MQRLAGSLTPQKLEKAYNNLDEYAQEEEKAHEAKQSVGWREWVQKALSNGAGRAHAWTSQRVKAPPLPERSYDQEKDARLEDPME